MFDKSDKDKNKKDLEKILKTLNPAYVKIVDAHAKGKSSFVFGNSSLSHASYITYKMLECAENEVLILSGRLCELFFENIKGFLASCAKTITNIKIITIQEDKQENIDKIKKYVKETNENTKTKKVIEYLPLQNKGQPENFQHFYVIDGKAWRKEDPHGEIKDKDDIHADVCFNDALQGRILVDFFRKIWEKHANSNTVFS